jgi:hypothetical protein
MIILGGQIIACGLVARLIGLSRGTVQAVRAACKPI